MSFVHLHNHTHYSLLDGLTQVGELVNHAKEQGSPAVAITDHGVMYGVIEFYQKCKKAGIKPIIGMEAYIAPGSRLDKEAASFTRNYHLLLLAKDNQGYHNLIELVSKAHLEGFYYKPRIDWELLEQHHDGLIALSACLGGEVPQLILSGDLEKAKEKIIRYKELFGEGNYYLELQDHPELEGQAQVNEQLIAFSKELGVPLVATNDSHYLRKEDDEAQDILLCLQNKKKKDDDNRMKMIGYGDYSVRSNKDMIAAFAHVPEAIENTLVIAEKCNVNIELNNIQLPYFEVPEGYDGDSYLRYLCEEGLRYRYGAQVKTDGSGLECIETDCLAGEKYSLDDVWARLNYELETIAKMGWPSYFLIVSDFVNWAKDNGIVVGPGRGSAAGSLVCYLTRITDLDPLKYELLFERFLNPDRISMPDIDMDFADVRREDVIRYVEGKYGKDHVAQIITFGTMAARAAIRDVGRVLDEPYSYCDKLSKSVPMFAKFDEALKTVPELREMYENEEAAKRIIDYAKRLEGVARHASTHACGVLITKDPVTAYAPVQYASSSDKTVVSQYSLHPVEDLGLLKMDFLGLKNLTIIESAIKIIKNTRDTVIDISRIPLDDQATFELFQKGETTGVFQFESSGMKRYLKELRPNEFEDIIAMVALYRPGPMEWIPEYIAGKHGDKKVSYLHPKLEGVLKKTYGVAIYQEQVMQISRALAGFTPGEADVLRKAMGKKIASLLAEQKEKFIDGCVKNNVHKELAEKVFSFIEPFAGYGFNRSHAACYALVAYQTAYLKAHWPVEFMAALLTSDQHNTDRVTIEIEECKKMEIKIMPPDINESFASFTVVTQGTAANKTVDENDKVDTIRFGLNAIKNVGEHIVEEVIKERKANGPYKDIFDLLERVDDKDLNKKSLESLIKCGGLDRQGERGSLLGNLDRFLNFSKEISQVKASGQASLFASLPQEQALPKLSLLPFPPAAAEEKLQWEKDLLGLYVSEHPFSKLRSRFNGYVKSLRSVADYPSDELVTVSGIISSIKKIVTKKGESMLFVKIDDETGSLELLVFPSVLKDTLSVWQDGLPVIARGRKSDKDGESKVLIEIAGAIDMKDIDKSVDAFKHQAMNFKDKRFKKGKYPEKPAIAPRPAIVPKKSLDPIKVLIKEEATPETSSILLEALKRYPGERDVYVKFLEDGKFKVAKLAIKADLSAALQEDISESSSGLIEIVSD